MKKKILIADDEACVIKVLKDRFTYWGYLVETASDGEETAFSNSRARTPITDELSTGS